MQNRQFFMHLKKSSLYNGFVNNFTKIFLDLSINAYDNPYLLHNSFEYLNNICSKVSCFSLLK